MTSSFLACAPRSTTVASLVQSMRSNLSQQLFTQVPQLTSGTALAVNNLAWRALF
jgi:hypothetical protein